MPRGGSNRLIRVLTRAPEVQNQGGLSTTCTPPGLSWGSSPGFSWGAVLGQAQRRGGMNCPLGSFPLLPKAVRVQSGGSSPEVLRSAELLSPSTVGGLRVTACFQVRGSHRWRGWGLARQEPLTQPPAPTGVRQQVQGSPGGCQGRCHCTPSPPPHLVRGVRDTEALAKQGTWVCSPVPGTALGVQLRCCRESRKPLEPGAAPLPPPLLPLAAFSFSLNFLGLFFCFFFFPS